MKHTQRSLLRKYPDNISLAHTGRRSKVMLSYRDANRINSYHIK